MKIQSESYKIKYGKQYKTMETHADFSKMSKNGSLVIKEKKDMNSWCQQWEEGDHH